MASRKRITDNIDVVITAMKNAESVDEFRRLQCVFLGDTIVNAELAVMLSSPRREYITMLRVKYNFVQLGLTFHLFTKKSKQMRLRKPEKISV